MDAAQIKFLEEVGVQILARRGGEYEKCWGHGEQGQNLPLLEELEYELAPDFFREALMWAFPETSRGIVSSMEHAVGWRKGFPEIANRVGGRERSWITTIQSPGSDVMHLDAGEKGGEWVDYVVKWVNVVVLANAKDAVTPGEMASLGEELSRHYKFAPRHVMKRYPVSGRYIITYHFEPVNGEHSTHGCGAHGSDTLRAILMAIAQACILTWALRQSDLSATVSIAIRRTRYKDTEAGFFDVPSVYKKFESMHFVHGMESPDVLLLGKKEFPDLRSLHTVVVGINTNGLPIEYPSPCCIVECVDDRVRFVENNGVLLPSQISHHVADSCYVTIGGLATEIFASDVPLRCYAASILSGVMSLRLDMLSQIREQMLYVIPLIFTKVMDESLCGKRQLFIDVVVGGQPLDINNTLTRSILQDNLVRQQAGLEDIPPEYLTQNQLKRLVIVHADLIAAGIDNILQIDLISALRDLGYKLRIETRIIRLSRGAIETRSYSFGGS